MSTVPQAKARAKARTNKEYLDASAEDFSVRIQHLLAQEREIYDTLKEKRAQIVAQLREEMTCAPGREPIGTRWMRWGQWVIVVADKSVAKARTTSRRKTYAE
jgi:hypothetical protein